MTPPLPLDRLRRGSWPGQMPSVHRQRDGGAPKKESSNTGLPNEDQASTVTIAARSPSLEQVLLSTVNHATTRKAGGDADADDDDERSADEPPTSWSFAARQRYECARIARVFRFARHRIRQELRGLALDHGERLLGAVARKLVPVPEEKGTGATAADGVLPGRAAVGERKQRERPGAGHGRFDSPVGEGEREQAEGPATQRKQPGQPGVGDQEQGGKEEDDHDDNDHDDDDHAIRHQVVRRRRNLRHEARPYDAWNMRWALAVDEGDMADLPTLALEPSLLEEAIGHGSEAGAEEGADLVVTWRKAFREAVISTGGKRDSLAPNRCETVPRLWRAFVKTHPRATWCLAFLSVQGKP